MKGNEKKDEDVISVKSKGREKEKGMTGSLKVEIVLIGV